MTRPRPTTRPAARQSPAPAPLTPEQELALLCAPMSAEADPELAEAREDPRDTLEAWTRRVADVCPRCGLRRFDAAGVCGACGGRKS